MNLSKQPRVWLNFVRYSMSRSTKTWSLYSVHCILTTEWPKLHHLVTFQHSEKRCHHVFNMWERISTGNKIANNQWMTKLFPLKFFTIYCCYRQNIASEKLKKKTNILFSFYKARVQLLSLNTFKVDCEQQITSSRLVCKTWMHVQHAHGARDKLGEGWNSIIHDWLNTAFICPQIGWKRKLNFRVMHKIERYPYTRWYSRVLSFDKFR